MLSMPVHDHVFLHYTFSAIAQYIQYSYVYEAQGLCIQYFPTVPPVDVSIPTATVLRIPRAFVVRSRNHAIAGLSGALKWQFTYKVRSSK